MNSHWNQINMKDVQDSDHFIDLVIGTVVKRSTPPLLSVVGLILGSGPCSSGFFPGSSVSAWFSTGSPGFFLGSTVSARFFAGSTGFSPGFTGFSVGSPSVYWDISMFS